MASWEIRDGIDQGHRIPADRSRPEVRSCSRLFVGPAHLPGLVPTVVEQSGFRITRMGLDQHELRRDVAESGGLLEHGRILCVKRFGHVEAVEPHLVRISLFMPEAAGRRSRLHVNLLADDGCRLVVLLFSCPAVEKQEFAAEGYFVETEVLRLVRGDCAVIGHQPVHAMLDITEVPGVSRVLPYVGEPSEEDVLVIGPIAKSFAVERYPGIRPALDGGVGHALRPRLFLGENGARHAKGNKDCTVPPDVVKHWSMYRTPAEASERRGKCL